MQEHLLAEWRRLGAEVFSTSDAEAGSLTDDPDDPSRALIRQVLGAVAQYGRSMIALRLRSGRARKAANGGFAYGSPPFGIRAEGGELVPDAGEQATLSRTRQLRSAGKSLRGIAKTLEAEGHSPRRSTRWHPETLRRIVERMGDQPPRRGRRMSVSEPHVQDSTVQRLAGHELVQEFGQSIGCKLEPRRVELPGGARVEVDGISDDPPVACEAYARIGKPQAAQRRTFSRKAC